jgi:small-conductance mechanosensitive channel/CRP-like cAMP-binding protein
VRLEPWVELALYVAGWLALTVLLTVLARRLDRSAHPLRGTTRALRGLFLPLVLVYLVAWRWLGWSTAEGREHFAGGLHVIETLLWLAGIVVALSLVTNTALMKRDGTQYESRYPKLLVDILRLLLVLVGACFVISGVWDKDLGGLLTAVGISSIVLGLALQNTLDNVMAGIAVLFEQPFQVGDWITVGSTTGEVMEMNWRSVRVRTRSRDLVIVPNSVIGKETLVNLSRPTRLHAETHVLGFSYGDAPNTVKRVLSLVVRATRGVLAEPPPAIRTVSYSAYSIDYQVRFFIDDYARQQTINDEFMTRVWYAAKRNGLTIPFPTQTSFEYHRDLPEAESGAVSADMLTSVPIFVPLSPAELASLAQECARLDFGRGERVVHQGEPGDAMYVVLEGTAVVTLAAPDGNGRADGAEREVARLARGEFFGEMALLTGEPRSASVTAVDDLAVLVIHKDSLQATLASRPGLVQEMAEIVEARRGGLRATRDLASTPAEQTAAVKRSAGELAQRMLRFFGL